MQLKIRYDMNSPSFGAPHPVLYRTAIDQSIWADKLGFDEVCLAEHHGAEDGYCPSSMIQAASILGATENITAHLSALVVTMHDPLRLAEDLAVLDNIAPGRIIFTAGMGYRPHEFEMFGRDITKRLAIMNETMATLKAAWTGEPFEFRGRTVRVTPRPATPGGPKIYMGGSTEKSAIRAAKAGYQYYPGHPDLFKIYEAEREKAGFPPPEPQLKSGPSFLYVSDDPDRDWPLIAPHVAYATNTYAEWAKERGVGQTRYGAADSIEALKAMPNIEVLTPDECFDLLVGLGDQSAITFHALLGGLDPEISWRGLRLFESAVLPRLREVGLVKAK
ncbi:MAG: LLM class flavin-dependent oxidoreductase [Alphaproteobacteria bacterium HGW-Alphaproteobacteria-13]|jgi:alkanesulfonate monooxygenase SsuD/methylene tetrahydromethanopterin reductase-like flavin-dependent oxidoreductase (luciferase family)|nr:MAG: LLM class flavin-dependent oxidoreductase [Alphaproteobacteria bacterium HGW-Alphaproteobacteria-13]